MSSELLFNLIVIIGAIIVVPFSRAMYGTWLTAGLLYSFGWVSMLLCYHYLDLVSPDGYVIPTSSFEFGAKVVFGGYVGVFFGHLFFKVPTYGYERMHRRFVYLGPFISKYYLWVCAGVFIVGIIALIDQFRQVGFSIFTLQDLRGLHANSRFSLAQRLGVLGSLFLGIVVGLSAVDDALKGRVNVRRVLIIIVAMLPLAISKGSRQEFLNPVVIYGVHMFIVMQSRALTFVGLKWEVLRRVALKFLPLMAVLFVVFTLYGQLRTVASKTAGGQFTLFSLAEAPLEVSTQVSSWLASSLYSLGPITDFEDATFPRMHGRIVLEPFFKIPEKLRLIPNKGVLIYLAREDAFNEFNQGIIAFTPGTMGKVLTREVGKKWAPVLAATLVFFLVAMCNRLPRDSILNIGIVYLCMWQVLMTFQTIQGLSMAIAWRLVFLYFIGLQYKKYVQRFWGAANATMLK